MVERHARPAAIPEQFEFGRLRIIGRRIQRRRIIGSGNSFHDAMVGVAVNRRESPDDAGAGRLPIRRQGQHPAGHASQTGRSESQRC